MWNDCFWQFLAIWLKFKYATPFAQAEGQIFKESATLWYIVEKNHISEYVKKAKPNRFLAFGCYECQENSIIQVRLPHL